MLAFPSAASGQACNAARGFGDFDANGTVEDMFTGIGGQTAWACQDWSTCEAKDGMDTYCSNLPPAKQAESLPPANSKPSSTENLSGAEEASTNEAATKMQNNADNLSAGQAAATKAALEVNHLGAIQAATMSALYCADGANRALVNDPAAAEQLSRCEQQGTAADRLSGGRELSADEATLSLSDAQATLQRFEKNFGVSQDEYLRRFLKRRTGGTLALSELTAAKIGTEKLAGLLASAEPAAPSAPAAEPDQFALDLAAKRKGPSVRATVKKYMAEQAAKAKAAAKRTEGVLGKGTRVPAAFDKLEPLGGVFAQNDANDTLEELTLFQVVHRKYMELSERNR